MGNFEQIKPWFSKKFENYGYKTEMSVRQQGVAMLITPHRPGAASYIAIAREYKNMHLKKTTKRQET